MPEGTPGRDEFGTKKIELEEKLKCTLQPGVEDRDKKYSFWSLPDNRFRLISDVLENKYKHGEKVESKYVEDFRKEHNIPANADLKLGFIEYILNARELCNIVQKEIHFGFESSEQYIDTDFRSDVFSIHEHDP